MVATLRNSTCMGTSNAKKPGRDHGLVIARASARLVELEVREQIARRACHPPESLQDMAESRTGEGVKICRRSDMPKALTTDGGSDALETVDPRTGQRGPFYR